jgi:hypothetical protein
MSNDSTWHYFLSRGNQLYRVQETGSDERWEPTRQQWYPVKDETQYTLKDFLRPQWREISVESIKNLATALNMVPAVIGPEAEDSRWYYFRSSDSKWVYRTKATGTAEFWNYDEWSPSSNEPTPTRAMFLDQELDVLTPEQVAQAGVSLGGDGYVYLQMRQLVYRAYVNCPNDRAEFWCGSEGWLVSGNISAETLNKLRNNPNAYFITPERATTLGAQVTE